MCQIISQETLEVIVIIAARKSLSGCQNIRSFLMTEWFAVISITIFAVISPGPDFAMVSRNSLLLSRRAGLLTALGIGGGVLVHVAYTLLGIGILIRQSPALFDILKLVGAAYLVWLGGKMLMTRKDREGQGRTGERKGCSFRISGVAHRVSDECSQSQDNHFYRQLVHAGGRD
jgi:hypothetical protein